MASRVKSFFVRRPALTNIANTAFSMALADLMCQKVEKTEQIDWHRTWILTTYAGCISGPALHVFYHKLYPLLGSQSSTRVVLLKILVNQTLWVVPSVYTFFFVTTLMKGGTREQARAETDLKANDTILLCWSTWPFLQFFTFKYVPVQWHVAWVNQFALLWNVYMSYKSYQQRQNQS